MFTKLKTNINNTISNFKLLSTKNKALTLLGFCFMCFCMICCGVLCSKITAVYIDDVMYGDWAKHGLGYFIEKNIWHMQNFNGRTFIHMCLEIVTIFKQNLYMILMPLFLVTPFIIFFKLQNKDKKLSSKSIYFATAMSFVLFFLLGYKYINTTLMWMAGGFNYIFPLFVIAIAYWVFSKNRLKEKTSILTIVLLFLCGATTEQYGMFTIGMVTLTLFFDLLNKEKIKKNIIRYFIPTILGYITIFATPGTFNRFMNSNEYATKLEYSLIDMLFNNCKYTIGGQGNIIVLLIFFMLIGCLAIGKNSKYSKLCITALPVAILSMALYYTVYLEVVYISCVLELIILCIAFCLKKETREQAKLLICGTGTFLMMSITMATGTRTSLPFMLCICIITTNLLYELSKKIKRPTLACITVALCIMFMYSGTYAPLLNGYSNSKVYTENLVNELSDAKNTGVIMVDYDQTLASDSLKYRYTTMFDLPYGNHQLEFYSQYFDIPENIRYEFKSETYTVSSIKCNDKHIYHPAVLIDGDIYVPYALTITFNFDTKDKTNMLTFWENETLYQHNEIDSQLIIKNKTTNEVIKTIDTSKQFMWQYSGPTKYINLNDFCEWLNLTYTYNEQENIYIIERNQ